MDVMPCRLEIFAPGQTATRVTLTAPLAVIGRGPDCALRLDHPTVGRRHVQLQFIAPRWFVTDLGSPNGAYLNGRRLGTQPEPLPAQATLRLGVYELRFSAGGDFSSGAPSDEESSLILDDADFRNDASGSAAENGLEPASFDLSIEEGDLASGDQKAISDEGSALAGAQEASDASTEESAAPGRKGEQQ